MKTASLRRVMQLVLAAAATDAAIACGGAITSSVDGDPSGSATSNPETPGPGTDPGTETQPPKRPQKPEARPDGGPKDASIDVATKDSGTIVTGCVNGSTTPNPELCCKTPGDPNCESSGSGDQCALDCATVCAKFAPNTGGGFTSCYWSASATNPEIFYMCGACGVGRIPDGMASCERGDSIAERLAMQAYYEAASVIAFRRLADILAVEGAPSSLVDRARRAAADEERHAATFTVLATARGAVVPTPKDDGEDPSLLQLAIENAREGCVRETFGALVALHQAEHAEDAELRAAFASIADDEIAHAALSWDLAAWFDARLGHDVDRARAEAVRVLRDAATRDHDAVDHALGMPRPTQARAMFDDLFARLAA